MDVVCYYLRAPFDNVMERSIQVGSFIVNRDMQGVSKLHYVVSSIFYLIIAIPSVALFGVAAVVDSIKQRSNPRKFTELLGSGVGLIEGRNLLLLSWNVCMLFGGLPIPFGGMAPVNKRINEVATKILRSGSHIVSLQEVSPPAAARLYRLLKSCYKFFYTRINPDPLFTLDSGLFVASKVKLHDPEVVPIPLGGVMKRCLFTFKVNGKKIGVTHLEPGREQEAVDLRKRQIKTIRDQKLDYLAGDLNIVDDNEFNASVLDVC